jgi:DNA-directed RNA polymerase specialized sigma24 family protein
MLANDADLVLAARSGDRAAIRTIHDRYCGRVFDHCSAVLRDPEVAGEVLLETFMLAFVELHRLKNLAKLEPWLFALARDQMLYRPRSPLVPPDRDDLFDPLTVRARAVTWEAAAWFPRRERILLDLHLRQRLERQELADAIGATIPHAIKLASIVDARMNRLVGALLVARFAPDCVDLPAEDEHAFDPRVTMRRYAHHVDRCPRCSAAELELPAATELLASVPAEAEPPELRDEALERVHVMLRALESPGTMAPASASAEERRAPVSDLDDADDLDAFDDYEDDSYDVVFELTPPPVPLRRNGFPKSLFPERRRLVTLIAAVVAGIVALALGFDARGGGSGDTRLLAAGAAETAGTSPTTTVPTTPATTAVPASTAPSDTFAPSITNLTTTYACIGRAQLTTDALATVSDDEAIESVDLIITHDVLGATRKRMLASGGQYRAQIGPYTNDGTITWTVEAVDQSGNVATGVGPPVASASDC